MSEVFDAAFTADPWPVLRELRADGGVHRVRTPDGPPAWLVTRYADVRAALVDDGLATHVRHAGDTDYRGFTVPPPLDAHLLNAEPADHARLRRLVTAEFSPRRLAQWSATAPELVDRCLREVKDSEVDLVEAVAVPLPAMVLGELLGLPDEQRESLRTWANSTLLPSATPPRARDTLATMLSVITATIRHPHQDTVLARLVSSNEVGPDELAGLLFYLIFVWYEVLVDLVAAGTLALTRTDEVRTDATAVDELLRFTSPQMLAGPRFALADMAIGDQTIRKGQTVLLSLAAANRDPERFTDPDRLDLTRTDNPHLGLGHGTHACLGTALVRAIGEAALTGIFTRWPDLTVTEPEIGWRSGFRHRGPLALRASLWGER